MEFIKNSAFFGAMISLIAYEIGLILKKKFKMAIFNPLLISIICVIGVLLIFHIDYDDYNEGGKYISYLLTPATVCLAVPLYEQIHLLKKNLKAVAAGIFSGTLAGLCSILLMAKLFGFDHQEYVTMLPKSITTAIGMGVSEELGGIVTITVAVIIITGVLGDLLAEVVYKIAKIEEPIARGLGLGTSAHAIGTAKAIKLGPGRRSHEQPCHCRSRIAYGCRSVCVCGNDVKADIIGFQMPFQSVTFYKSVVYGRLFLWILKTNIFLYKINKCSEKPYLYRFIGLKMSYNANIQKICLENMFDKS